MDIIDIPFREHRPQSHQSENWLLEPRLPWLRAGRATWLDLFPLSDYPLTLWKNGSSSFNGLNDRVSLADCRNLDCSLYLIHLYRIKFRVFTPGGEFGRGERRLQAAFRYKGVNYMMWVTDPALEKPYLTQHEGEYRIGECYATVSLSEPFLGHCYKLVASVIPREPEAHVRC